jgi:hypothetical protein
VKAPEEEIGAEEEEERHEGSGCVVRQLNDQLFDELMQGFHAWGTGEGEVESESSDEEEEEGTTSMGMMSIVGLKMSQTRSQRMSQMANGRVGAVRDGGLSWMEIEVACGDRTSISATWSNGRP